MFYFQSLDTSNGAGVSNEAVNELGVSNGATKALATNNGSTKGIATNNGETASDQENGSNREKSRSSKVFVAEGSIICVSKPVIMIEFQPITALPGETVLKTIKPTATVTSIKGLALERLKNMVSPDVMLDPKLITVQTGDGIELKSNQSLVDFILPYYVTLIVHYPEDRFTFKPLKSLELDLDDDFLSILHSEND